VLALRPAPLPVPVLRLVQVPPLAQAPPQAAPLWLTWLLPTLTSAHWSPPSA
jgi:hypothetical protein